MIIVATVCIIIVALLLILSLQSLFHRPPEPGPVEDRLDLALEVELICDSIERMANGD